MKKLLTLSIIVLVITAVVTQSVSIFISNTSALQSIDVTKIKAEIAEVSESNMALSAQVLKYSSYATIASRAAELGFESNKSIVSVYDPIPLAINR